MNFDDEKIIELYHARSETAIAMTQQRYGTYLTSIAHAVTGSEQDAEECVNDTYLRAWESIPPARPIPLRPYLARITRNLAIDRAARGDAQKRGGGELTLMLSELADTLPDTLGSESEEGEISAAIDAFLRKLPTRERVVFIRRYFYADSVAVIAERNGMSYQKAASMLHRLRKKLRTVLEKENIIV